MSASPRFSIGNAVATVVASLAVLSMGDSLALCGEGRLGLFEDHADVGAPKIAGAAAYNAASQEYALSAAGLNMWAERDEFHFAWNRMKGDFILQAQVELVGKGVEEHRKLGLIVRSALDADSPYADVAVHGDGLTSLQYRRTRGAETLQEKALVTGPDVIQLERKGSTYILSAARQGEPYAVVQVSDLPLGDEVYAGLFLCSHNPNVVERAIFRNVRVIRPAKPDFVPYRDYIGSLLEIVDVQSGRRQVIHRSKEPFEAPNWTRDGSALIFNSSGGSESRGRLHRFDLLTRQASVIDTGFANRNNNDHVISFDGTMIAISDQSSKGDRIHGLHAAAPGRRAEADHAAHARPTFTAGRQTASTSSTRGDARTSSTSTGWLPTAAGPRRS